MSTHDRDAPVDNPGLPRKHRATGWTVREIETQLELAALTLRRVPVPGSGPRGYGSSWPEVVREARHAYGYHEARMRIVPSAAEIDAMDEAIAWLRFLAEPLDRHIVWMRAAGYRWRQICNRVGVSRSTAHRRWMAALLTISNHLNRKEKTAAQRAGAKTKPAQAR